VAYLVKAPRVGRSQGAVIFWGLVSAFFASAFCYYYIKNRTNEEDARKYNEQVTILQGERDSLSSERDKMEAATSDADKQLRARADFLQEKETKLAEEQSEIESMGAPGGQSQPGQSQAAGVKRFDETARKLVAGTPGADVVVRGGRPVLRLPSSIFFAAGDAQLLPGGKTILNQAAGALGGQGARFELRVETFSDSGSESAAKSEAKTPARTNYEFTAKKDDADATGQGAPEAVPAANAKPPRYANAWELTAARAAAIARYLRDQGTLPFQNVLVMARGDSQSGTGGSKAHDRRVEITLAPLPVPFHASETAKSGRAKPSATPSLAPPPDPPVGDAAP
jgi:flagellar motor protein MotB